MTTNLLRIPLTVIGIVGFIVWLIAWEIPCNLCGEFKSTRLYIWTRIAITLPVIIGLAYGGAAIEVLRAKFLDSRV